MKNPLVVPEVVSLVFAITEQPEPDPHGIHTGLVVPGHPGAFAATLASERSINRVIFFGCLLGDIKGKDGSQTWYYFNFNLSKMTLETSP